MSFIEEDKLAALYREVDQEKEAAAFYHDLHQKNKERLLRYSIYRTGFFAAMFALLIGGIYLVGFSNAEDDATTLSRIEQLELENKILGGSTEEIQNTLETTTVYTVQFLASSGSDVLLFSKNFINFRAHPLQAFNAYSLGNFSTEEEAEAFRQELIEMGLNDLWVTSYQGGKRILLD